MIVLESGWGALRWQAHRVERGVENPFGGADDRLIHTTQTVSGEVSKHYPQASRYATIMLFISGMLEIGWAVGLKYTEGLTHLWPSVATVAAMAVSMALRGVAIRTLPVGTAYAQFIAICSSSILAEMRGIAALFLRESRAKRGAS